MSWLMGLEVRAEKVAGRFIRGLGASAGALIPAGGRIDPDRSWPATFRIRE